MKHFSTFHAGYTRKYRQILTISYASFSVRKNIIFFILNVFPVCLENVPFMSYDCDYCNMQYSQEHYFSRHFTGWHNPKRLDMLAILAGWGVTCVPSCWTDFGSSLSHCLDFSGALYGVEELRTWNWKLWRLVLSGLVWPGCAWGGLLPG